MYPLRFEPIFRDYLWGGRRLESLLGKDLGEGDCFAESWEVVDHGTDQSLVLEGEWQGLRLGDLVRRYPLEICGRETKQFPLLFKFLDAQKSLSVQVHPNDQQGARLDPPDLGKTEAWVVVHAEPESRIYAGLRSGVDRRTFSAHIAKGVAEECLHVVQPLAGDCIFIPAGSVHAIGAGLVIAEIQQASDTTFRVYDWNRVGADGNPRALHVEQALDVIDFDRGPIAPIRASSNEPRQRLVSCDKFTIDRHHSSGDVQIGGDGHLHIVAVMSGEAVIGGDPCDAPFVTGQTCLLPAGLGVTTFQISNPTVLLDMWC